ncbi:MAG TPA: hypothetical protein VIM04_08610 [Candidatus Binatia bacterium]|jgi:hypothetical protein
MSAITKVVLAPILLILWCVPLLAQEKVTFPMAASTKTAGYSPPVGGTEAGLLCPAGPRSPAGRHSPFRQIDPGAGWGSFYAALLGPDAPMVTADRGLDTAIIAGSTQCLAHWILGTRTIDPSTICAVPQSVRSV